MHVREEVGVEEEEGGWDAKGSARAVEEGAEDM